MAPNIKLCKALTRKLSYFEWHKFAAESNVKLSRLFVAKDSLKAENVQI